MESHVHSQHAVDNNSSAGSDSTLQSPAQTRCRVYHFILPSRNGDHVLAEVDRNRVARLPSLELPAGGDPGEKEDAMERNIEAVAGPSVYIVRKLSDEERMEDFEYVGMDYLYLGEVLDAKPVVLKPFKWIPRDEASRMDWAAMSGEGVISQAIRTEVERVFQEKNGETSVTKFYPWRNVGWFEEMTLWCQKLLDARKMVMAGRIRRRNRTADSVVMSCEVKIRGKRKLEEKDGSFELIFIKIILPAKREVERTVAVAGVIGDIVPEIIGFEERRGLLMMRNGGSVTDEAFDQEAVIDTVLKMQKLSMNRINELESGGLRVRDSEWVESNVESILNHELLDRYYAEYGDIDEDKKEAVDKARALVGLIQKKCGEITKLGLPKTLVHGDLLELNVGSPMMKSEGKVYRFFDWAESFIGNPLHDFERLLLWRRGGVDSDRDGVELSIDVDAGMKQICRAWKMCCALNREEMKSVFRTLREMHVIIRVHDQIREYEEFNDNNHERVGAIIGALNGEMELL